MIFALWSPNKPTAIAQDKGAPTQYFLNWMVQLYALIKATLGQGIGASAPVTVTLAKLTTGGSNGSLTVVNGVITSYTAPT